MKESTWLIIYLWETKKNKGRLAMGRARNYELGLYNEFEKLNQKLDKANSTILAMSLTIDSLHLEIKNIKKN